MCTSTARMQLLRLNNNNFSGTYPVDLALPSGLEVGKPNQFSAHPTLQCSLLVGMLAVNPSECERCAYAQL